MLLSTLQLETIDGEHLETQGRVVLRSVEHRGRDLGPVEAFFVPLLPLNFDLVLGFSLLQQHGCLIEETEGRLGVRWGPGVADSIVCKEEEKSFAGIIEEEDFVAWFQEGEWYMKWE